MYLILLISGIAFIHQAHSLTCNRTNCEVGGDCDRVKTIECEAEFTRCGVVKYVRYKGLLGGAKESDFLYLSCIKADTCNDASYSHGETKHFYTTKCCETDLCNSELVPPPPTRKPAPNGRKCNTCNGEPECNSTMDCTGDETFCYTDRWRADSVYMGCATKNYCFNAPSMISNPVLSCCDEDLCNSAISTSVCLTLLITMLILLISYSSWDIWSFEFFSFSYICSKSAIVAESINIFLFPLKEWTGNSLLLRHFVKADICL